MPAAHDLRDLALATGPPTASVLLHDDGAMSVAWANSALAQLVGLDPDVADDDPLPLLDVLTEGSRSRLAAVVRDLVALRGRAASVQLSAGTQEFRLHLVVPPQETAAPTAPVRAVLHAERWPSRQQACTGDHPEGRDQLLDRLDSALRRLRRRASRVALALATVHQAGAVPVSAADAAELLDRVRSAARETDTVVLLQEGRIAVLADDGADDGGIAMARRVLAVLHGSLPDDRRPVAQVTVMAVDDAQADPDAVLQRLEAGVAHRKADGGLTVLDSLRPDAARSGSADVEERLRADARIRAALASGRFVLRSRPVVSLGAAHEDPALTPAVLAEVCTVDDGVASPVRVDAPGLAVALDRWALGQVQRLETNPATRRFVLRLQPSGPLTPLGDAAAALREDRGDREWVLQVPERRLKAEAAAQRALVRDLPGSGVGLAVADWTGLLDVRSLVRLRVELVELSPRWGQDVLLPEGTAALAGLVAGLRAGLGSHATVIADQPTDFRATRALVASGVEWAALRHGFREGGA